MWCEKSKTAYPYLNVFCSEWSHLSDFLLLMPSNSNYTSTVKLRRFLERKLEYSQYMLLLALAGTVFHLLTRSGLMKIKLYLSVQSFAWPYFHRQAVTPKAMRMLHFQDIFYSSQKAHFIVSKKPGRPLIFDFKPFEKSREGRCVQQGTHVFGNC